MDLSEEFQHNSETYTFQHPRPQSFSIPFVIIKDIILKNPTGKAWKKLIQTCKYFFSKNSIYPIGFFNADTSIKWYFDNAEFNPANAVPKIWLYNEMVTNKTGLPQNTASLMATKIFKCEIIKLNIGNQNLTLKEFQFLTASDFLKCLFLRCCSIKDSADTEVTFDKLLENLKNLEDFQMICIPDTEEEIFEEETVKKMIQHLSRFKTLHRFCLYGLPESFDFSSFIDFLKNNKTVKIELCFGEVPDAYIAMLDAFIDEIVANPPKKIPFIRHLGFDENARNKKYEKLYLNQK